MNLNKATIPIFSTHASLGGSILTSDFSEEIEETSPVSVIAIAKKYNLKKLYIVDNSMSLFIQCYENCKKLGTDLVWGFKANICNDSSVKNEKSIKTESKVIIWLNNSAAYKDIVKLYTKCHVGDFYYHARTDWKTLQNMWSDNFTLSIPFYNGFFHKNFFYGYSCMPEFSSIKPNFLINKMGMPYDDFLEEKIKFYTKDNQYETFNTHPVYYYKESDFAAYTVFKCIHNREKFESPNMDNFFSNQFSFETYLRNQERNRYE